MCSGLKPWRSSAASLTSMSMTGRQRATVLAMPAIARGSIPSQSSLMKSHRSMCSSSIGMHGTSPSGMAWEAPPLLLGEIPMVWVLSEAPYVIGADAGDIGGVIAQAFKGFRVRLEGEDVAHVACAGCVEDGMVADVGSTSMTVPPSAGCTGEGAGACSGRGQAPGSMAHFANVRIAGDGGDGLAGWKGRDGHLIMYQHGVLVPCRDVNGPSLTGKELINRRLDLAL